MAYKKFRGRRPARRVRYSRAKRMVTGHGPTVLEQVASGVGSVAKLASAVVPIISAINTEEKYYDETAAFVTYNTGANSDLRCLTDAISQGVDDSNRIGNSILARNLQLRIASSMPMTTTGVTPVLGAYHRVILLCWKDNATDNPPSAAKILEDSSNIYSPLNKNYTDSFVVLKDKHMVFNARCTPGTAATATQDFHHWKWFKKLNWHMRWQSPSGGIGQTQNHIYMLTMSTPTGASNAIGTTFYSRLNYTDN